MMSEENFSDIIRYEDFAAYLNFTAMASLTFIT